MDAKDSENTVESAAFTTSLFGRMIGTAAEVDDHTNKERNMDMWAMRRVSAAMWVNLG